MIGLVCHYTLDKCCHPYVNAHCKDSAGHHLMEAAFDRYIMTRHGLTIPRYQCLPAAGLDYEAMASLWPGMDADTVRPA
jgi:uncharacterized protein YchJ